MDQSINVAVQWFLEHYEIAFLYGFRYLKDFRSLVLSNNEILKDHESRIKALETEK